jgi:alpha-glucosidase
LQKVPDGRTIVLVHTTGRERRTLAERPLGREAGRHTDPWWREAVIYQIYPRSFMDASGDSVGDLAGIAGKLDYLSWLGVDAVWLSPIFSSPMVDFGYDVADYTDVDSLFGTLADFDALLEEAHRLGMKVILDYVPNHTSSEHPWFLESRSSRENPKRDWYVWADPKPDGSLPNNWESAFGGPAWTFDAATGQYYLHLFDPAQPDLNWRNPDVRDAMYEVLRFWFERGVDGFRIDVLWLLIKDEELRDNPPNPDWRPGGWTWNKHLRVYSEDRPEVHEIVREMRAVADAYDDRLLIGEIYLPLERLLMYYGEDLEGIHLPFNFQLVTMEGWDARKIQSLVDDYEAALPDGAWPNWVLGNHDNPRISTKVGAQNARLAAMLLLTLRGTPTLYYGDEIGMENVPVPPEMARDPEARLFPGSGRDPYRAPMRWDSSPNAGFCRTDVAPWLPVGGDVERVNVEAQRDDPGSMLSLTRRLISLRRTIPALRSGSYEPAERAPEDCFAFSRRLNGQDVFVALNFGGGETEVPLPGACDRPWRVLLSTRGEVRQELRRAARLRGHEGLLLVPDQP